MASSLRGASIRAEFENVLKTVGRDFGSRPEGDIASDDADASAATHSSFEFLQALDTVSDSRSTPAGPAADDLRSFYSETEFEAETETLFSETLAGIETEADLDADEAQEAQHEKPGASARPAAPADRPEASDGADDPPPTTCDPASLMAELGLEAGMARAELQRLRRRFALKNHPDRLSPSRREAASRRMTIANSLIDAALRRAGRP